MSDIFELVDPEDAQLYLKACEAPTRQRGETYFRQGRVTNLSVKTPGKAYAADVQGSELYHVDLKYDEDTGWDGYCTCPMEHDCKHIYAAMKALVAENSVAAVRTISGGASFKTAAPLNTTKKIKASLNRDITDWATATLNRKLKKEEFSFCRKVHDVYQRCSVSQRISRWDFDDMGIRLGGYGWDHLRIWPEFPQTEHEFWLFVANAAKENNVKIPEFLEEITNLDEIQEQMAQWRRKQEIDRWKSLLGNVREGAGLAKPAAIADGYELRLALHQKHAELEWKRPGQEKFSPIKYGKFRELVEDCRDGRVRLSNEAEMLCHILAARLVYSATTDLQYYDPAALATLGHLLRIRSMEDIIVTGEGEKFTHAAEPLRWELLPADDANDNYRFRLVQNDGSLPPAFICAIPGHPAIFVTHGVVFKGPPTQEILDPAIENSIPAPAIESAAGLQFLQSLNLEAPARIRERVRRVGMDLVIQCDLRPIYRGAKTEHCVFHVVAESTDKKRTETWNGNSWVNSITTQGHFRKNEDDSLTVYDRSITHQVPALLEPLGLKYEPYSGLLSMRVTKKFADIFATWLKSVPPHINVQLAGELASLANATVSGNVRLDVTETTIDWFDLSVVINVTDTTLTQEEIKLLLNAKGGYVRLQNKGWKRLEFNLTDEEDERLANLGLNPHELTSEPQRLHALQLAHDSAKKFLPELQAEQIKRRATEIKARVTPDLPAGVKAELRPYQLEGFHFLAYLSTNNFGGILADDMGLGKTVQTLSWILWLREQAAAASKTKLPCLVCCPKSVMDNWHAEAGRFTPELRVKTWPASELNTFLNRLGEAEIHVLNYNQLRLLGETLVSAQWLAVILDEGQYIKNPSSQTAQVARALKAEHRLILSGTPIENRLLDLWSLMSFAMPGVLSSRSQFAKLYDTKGDPFARRRLAARVRPFLLRRTKTQVAKDLPERIEEDLLCEIEGEQKLLYKAELKRAQQLLLKVQTQQQLNKERFHFLTSLLRLRQICCHPALVAPESKACGAKMEALMEQLEPLMEEGHKVLVFSQFVELLTLLKPAFAERNWKTFYLAGETENRGDLVKEFQAAEGAAVFLISLKAGGFGLNLTAASYVVLFDPWWNPAVENQAIDRTHRIGQVNTVIAYRLLIKDSVEEKIRSLQKSKSALAQDVFGEEKFAQSLTIDDLQFLLAD